MVQHKGVEEELDLSHYGLNEGYSQALGQGLQLSAIKKINVSTNHMREPGPLNFVQALNKHVKEIDLSVNKVGMVSIDYFTKLLKTRSESLDLRIVKMDKA
jgi:hypothetical protein